MCSVKRYKCLKCSLSALTQARNQFVYCLENMWCAQIWKVVSRQTNVPNCHINTYQTTGNTDTFSSSKGQREVSYLKSKPIMQCIVANSSSAGFLNPLECATSNNTKLVHWPLMGGLLHLVQRGGAWAGWGPTQSPPPSTKYNNPPINGQCTNHCIAIWWSVALQF